MARLLASMALAVLLACHRENATRDAASVTAATRFAYSLEDSVAANRSAIRTRAALLETFARGFEDDVARRLTDRLWDSTFHEIIGTEPAIASPDSVVVLGIVRDSAMVAFTTPAPARWSAATPYTVAWLRRREGVWRVAGARDTAVAPADLPRPEPLPDGPP